jgi:hypothetical protein
MLLQPPLNCSSKLQIIGIIDFSDIKSKFSAFFLKKTVLNYGWVKNLMSARNFEAKPAVNNLEIIKMSSDFLIYVVVLAVVIGVGAALYASSIK